MTNKFSIDKFISLLYRQAATIPLENFSLWALDLLQQVIPFDAAIWATGDINSEQFHTQTSLNISPEIFSNLKKHLHINPIYATLIANKGQAADMSEVLNDNDFYQSDLYRDCYKPLAIERILSSIHLDEDSGVFTIVSLYRYNRQQVFTLAEKQKQNRLLYHVVAAAAYRQVLALNEHGQINNGELASALCDKEGVYHAVEDKFLALIAPVVTSNSQSFPIAIANKKNKFSLADLHFTQQKVGQLFRLTVRKKSVIDILSEREKQVVAGICQGSTFKQIAKQLHLSPSTVSNHLYRIYDKLNVHSRSQLVTMLQKQSNFINLKVDQ